ncbi:MAG: hypothetical protein NZ480_02145 [Bdellovibrionaceae bacterium]|nr:hypothetical protein [Pseudobdellovibrionaceae bacterium]MDW8190665.1 hypothetical protein [Pseudobdellovibrionaceae bacterium]
MNRKRLLCTVVKNTLPIGAVLLSNNFHLKIREISVSVKRETEVVVFVVPVKELL